MKKAFLLFAIILFGKIVLAGDPQSDSALVINTNDTVVFDLSQATCTGAFLDIPVSILSDEDVYALDFSLKFNLQKITYNSIINHKAYLSYGANYRTTDSVLSFTSNSFASSHIYDNNTRLVTVRFNLLSGPIKPSDFNTIKVYLNGDPCSYKIISNPLSSVAININGSPDFSPGDSVALNATVISGYTYLWSPNGQTTQTIYVKTAGTYSVMVTSAGGCTAIAAQIVNASSSLPVTLIDFHTKENNNQILISWSTASEINNDFFTVEKSANGNEWAEIVRVEGSGNTTSQKHYSIVDSQPIMGFNYYRLKQTDYDGTSSYSGTESQFYSGSKEAISKLKIYPNPASDRTVNLDLGYMSKQQTGTIKILTMTGYEVYATSFNTNEGDKKLSFHINSNVTEGVYLLEFSGETFHEVQILILH